MSKIINQAAVGHPGVVAHRSTDVVQAHDIGQQPTVVVIKQENNVVQQISKVVHQEAVLQMPDLSVENLPMEVSLKLKERVKSTKTFDALHLFVDAVLEKSN